MSTPKMAPGATCTSGATHYDKIAFPFLHTYFVNIVQKACFDFILCYI
jgi:hypothetical protein